MTRAPQPSPNWPDPRRTFLPRCEPTCDVIIRDIIEGRGKR